MMNQPGNPDLTAALQGADLHALSAACDQLRAKVGLPDHVLDHLLDDMGDLTTRTATWTCQTWWTYQLSCTHGIPYTQRHQPHAA